MSVETAGHAGTPQLRQLNMVNIDMFRHPKYYKELRKLRNNLDQAISKRATETSTQSVRPGPGLKLQAREDSTANSTRGQVAEPQASSSKLQASSNPEPVQVQASSAKRQASQPE